jgi:membrane protein required for colicin V production
MNFFDWIILVIVGFFLLKSAIRGGTIEIFSLLALIIAYILSCRYYSVLAGFLEAYINPSWAQNILAFVMLFILIYLFINGIGFLISRLLKHLHLSALDKIAGVFIGAAKGVFISCLLIIVLIVLLPKENTALKSSLFSLYSLPFIESISKYFPDPFKKIIDERTQDIKKSHTHEQLHLEEVKTKLDQKIKTLQNKTTKD